MGQYLSRVSAWPHPAPSASLRTGAETAWSDRAPAGVSADRGVEAPTAPAQPVRRGGYAHKPLSGKALLATALVHLAGVFILLNLGVAGQREKGEQRLAVFDVKTPTPPAPAPPPPEPQQLVVPQNPPPARITAPRAMLTLVSQQQAAPVQLEPRPAVAVHVEAPPAPSQPAAPPAPITPPDFSAAQLNNPGPEYPFQSRRDHEQGVALLRVLVTPEGRAGEVRLERSSGYSRLDRVAIKTVRRWRFVPARQAGVAVAAWVLVPVGFSLS